MNGSRVSANRFGGSDAAAQKQVLIQVQAGVGQLLIASNPLLAGIGSAAGLLQGRPVVGVERVASIDLLYVAPWLLFGVQHLLMSVVLIWLTARCLRRART
jgi:hypothetical protein